jgi:16S rRNA (guanine966-N2)-methyltransferase
MSDAPHGKQDVDTTLTRKGLAKIMRIIAGEWRGRTLKAPQGRGTRPTADRVREAVFSHLAAAEWWPGFESARVIDLFAGSGAFGLEAMSRGAEFALFVETDARARGTIRDNCEALGVMGNTRIHRRDVVRLGDKPAGLGERFDLAFLDPPYGLGLALPALNQLIDGEWLKPGACVVIEVGERETFTPPQALSIQWDRAFGAARILTGQV